MKKSLLALLTAGTMGCSNYKTPFLPTSVTLDSNEKGGYIFGEVNKETRNGEYCSREVLLGMEGGNLQSVVMTEHCKKLSGDNGKALAKRYKDTDNDGYVDLFFVSVDGKIYFWNLNVPYNPDLMDWPMFQHDPQHTGCYDCVDKSVSEEICTDSDKGKNYTIKGNVIVKGFPGGPPDSFIEDNCLNDNTLIEQYCDGDLGKAEEYTCLNDEVCSDGACVKKVPEKPTCLDSDGFDTSIKGYVDYDDKGYEDYCLVAGGTYKYVTEYYCGFNFWKLSREVKDKVEECEFSCSEGACIDQEEPVYKICNDNEPLDKLDVKGNVEFEGKAYGDECEESGMSVREYFCVGDKLRNFVKRCPEGTLCSNGICA